MIKARYGHMVMDGLRVYSCEVIMKPSLFKIGDKVKRVDHPDQKTYIINKISVWKNGWIYGVIGQGWSDGWAWVSEFNIERSE